MHYRRFRELLVSGPAAGLAALLDQDGPITDDSVLPPLWHWVYLLDRPAQRDLGPEGHPVHGIPEPPGPGLRRMFAGGRVGIRHPLRLGRPATRTVGVSDTRTRHGRSGELTIVTTRAVVEQDGQPCIVDEQDIVYREPSRLPSPQRDAAAAHAGWRHRDVPVDEIALFRFSALTFNSHRIHYDVDYCRDHEDYPGLVVHGPLQALLMAEAARRLAPAGTGDFVYRLIAPLNLGQGLRVGTLAASGSVHTDVRDAAGRRTALGEWRPAGQG